ncbi:hypothetical protein [Corynebacterium diphtheriae]|uniref:hypothetical protein n=2 Tax=Corynebacterium diphtheriae TaxID=1717 RepID=UPI0011607A9F|nr:hypothetical protein [Corynebacterium diphtheriae]
MPAVDDRCPGGYAGDVVADETIIDLAGPSEGLGVRPDKQRAAAYAGAYYIRDKTHQLGTGEKMREVTKRGFGIGVTAVSRVGSADDLYSVSPVITAISIDKPSPGSTVALGRALQMHQANGFAASVKTKANARLPYLCVDMGYSVRPDFTTVVHDHGFAPVMRYPVSRQTVWASEKPEFGSQSPGPVQINSAFYCPAALPLARQRRLVRRLNELLDEQDGFEAHDQALQKLLPLLMGTNSRPLKFVSKRKRSPETIPTYQIDLVCPAVQGRVKCPLKPESLIIAFDQPEVKPTWSADRYRCCSKSQIRHTYSSEQWKLAQWGMVPGSWEHAIYYEAARSLTEQRFSIMKSQHLSGREHLKWSPRREPMISVIIALWIAATNLAIQDSHVAKMPRPSSIKKQKRRLERDLGRALMSTPPRT